MDCIAVSPSFRRATLAISDAMHGIGKSHLNGGWATVNIDDIETLIKLFDRSGLAELELEQDETKLVLRRAQAKSTDTAQAEGAMEQQSVPAHAARTAETQPPEAPTTDGSSGDEAAEGYVVTSPIVGTFYRRPSPEEEPYVTVGDRVDAGDTVCIVEAMKVMNEVRTERAGIVKAILVEDAAAVEYGQALIRIDES